MREYTWCRECERAGRAITLNPKMLQSCPHCGSTDVMAWEIVRAMNGHLPHQPRPGETYLAAAPEVAAARDAV